MVKRTLGLIFKTRLSLIVLFLLLSCCLWFVLQSYRIGNYVAVLPLLFAVQIFLNDFLELYLTTELNLRGRWFAFVMAPGTILHELSHLFTAFFSGCWITDIKLFSINPKTGVLGYVSYAQPSDKWSVLRSIIIGLSPFFGCGLMLFILNYGIFDIDTVNVETIDSTIYSMFLVLGNFYDQLMDIDFSNPVVWIIFYLQICFALGSAPSTDDFKGSVFSLIRYPLSTIFILLVFLSAILIVEYPSTFGIYSRFVSDTILLGVEWAILVLMMSISILAISIPMVFIGDKFLEIKKSYRPIPVLMSIATYLLAYKITMGLKKHSLLVAILVFLLTLFYLRYPNFFVKPGRK